MRPALPFVLLALASCVATPLGIGGSTYPVGDAAVNSAIALGAAAQSNKTTFDCSTPCGKGKVCNAKTGACEPAPCGGTCRDDERCNENNIVPYCEAMSAEAMPSAADLSDAGVSLPRTSD